MLGSYFITPRLLETNKTPSVQVKEVDIEAYTSLLNDEDLAATTRETFEVYFDSDPVIRYSQENSTVFDNLLFQAMNSKEPETSLEVIQEEFVKQDRHSLIVVEDSYIDTDFEDFLDK